MRILILVLASVLVLAACSEEKPEPPATAAVEAVKSTAKQITEGAKSAAEQITEGAKSAVDALPAGVKQALPTFTNFSQMCAQCHDAEDVKRYETTFLPMYQMMFDPKAWANPNAYGRSMQPMMDPETYTKWYNAWMQRMVPLPGMTPPAEK